MNLFRNLLELRRVPRFGPSIALLLGSIQSMTLHGIFAKVSGWYAVGLAGR